MDFVVKNRLEKTKDNDEFLNKHEWLNAYTEKNQLRYKSKHLKKSGIA